MHKITINNGDDINIIISDKIKEDGRSVVKISESTGISLNMLYRSKNGSRNFSLNNAIKILHLLGYRIVLEEVNK